MSRTVRTVHVCVAQKHIDESRKILSRSTGGVLRCRLCPLALALEEAGYPCEVVNWEIYPVEWSAAVHSIRLPERANRFVRAFDRESGSDPADATPFEFDLEIPVEEAA